MPKKVKAVIEAVIEPVVVPEIVIPEVVIPDVVEPKKNGRREKWYPTEEEMKEMSVCRRAYYRNRDNVSKYAKSYEQRPENKIRRKAINAKWREKHFLENDIPTPLQKKLNHPSVIAHINKEVEKRIKEQSVPVIDIAGNDLTEIVEPIKEEPVKEELVEDKPIKEKKPRKPRATKLIKSNGECLVVA